ncbi:MAG: hypothetical protein ACOX71_00395 [Lachnospiraceae bacterium]|jgi:foldase protein PrsA
MMKKMLKKTAAVLLSAGLAVTALAGCGNKIDGTQTAVTVNGEDLSLGVVSFMSHANAASMVSYYGSFMADGYFDNIDEESGKTNGEDLVDSIVDDLSGLMIVRQKAIEEGITISDEEMAAIDAAAQGVIDKNDAELIEEMGFSKDDVAEAMTLDTYRSKMLPVIAEDADTTVDEESLKKTKLSLVTVSSETDDEGSDARKDIDSIYEKITASDDPSTVDFDEIANEVNEDYYATSFAVFTNGSDCTDYMSQEVFDALMALEEGGVSDVIYDDVKGRYCVVRLDAVYDEDATDTAIREAKANLKTEHYDEVLASWKEEAEITVNEKAVSKLQFTDKVWYTLAS